MGVDARLVVYAPTKKVAEDACTSAFAKMAELDTMMSDYRVNSELNRLCEKSGGPEVVVSQDLFKVLKFSLEVSRQTQGFFDVTVGPSVRLWRKARKDGVLPDMAEIVKARNLVGWKNIKLDKRKRAVRLALKGMQLDLGGIAKGYCDDEVQKVLKKFGIKSALVEMGGDIVVSKPPPGQDGWIIRVPNAGSDDKPVDMHLSNCAISSTGDTEQFAVIGGTRYSHVIDPHTGGPVTNRVQATVIAKRGLISDPLSKGFTFLDAKGQARLLRAYPGTRAFVKRLNK